MHRRSGVANDTNVFIDPVGADLWDGKAPEGLVPVTADTRRRYALITSAAVFPPYTSRQGRRSP